MISCCFPAEEFDFANFAFQLCSFAHWKNVQGNNMVNVEDQLKALLVNELKPQIGLCIAWKTLLARRKSR